MLFSGCLTPKNALRLVLIIVSLQTQCWAWWGASKEIKEVRVVMQSGSILPELKEYREIIISPGKVVLLFQGNNDLVHDQPKAWEVDIDEQEVRSFFTELDALDYSQVKRISPDIEPDGGHTKVYTISYTKGANFSMIFKPGVRYTNSQPIVDCVDTFVRSLVLIKN